MDKELKPYQRRTWVEINLDIIKSNFLEIKKHIKDTTKICCVIKANAYGHGAIELARVYEKEQADYLAVSNIEEAMQLREAGISLPILILGYTNPMCVKMLAKNNISQCLFSYEYGVALNYNAAKENVLVKTHIKVDSGMGRLGFQCRGLPNEMSDIVRACKLSNLVPEGIFTHFAVADEGNKGKQYTRYQYNSFISTVEQLHNDGIDFQIKHCSNSATIFEYPDMQLDMVRAGIVLYGLKPSEHIQSRVKIHPALKLKTIIAHIKTVDSGVGISYGLDYTTPTKMRIATIPVGYADGLWRSNFPANLCVEVDGKPAPIVGRICMDQCMIDVTNIPDAKIDSEVTIYGTTPEASADGVARKNSTISYEILCAIGERVPRVYCKSGKIVSVLDKLFDGSLE